MMNMPNQCHCCQPAANYTGAIENNFMENNNNQYDKFIDGVLYDPNFFSVENSFDPLDNNVQDWPVYNNQPSYSYLPNDNIVPIFEDLSSAKTFLQPYDPSLLVPPQQTVSPSFMPSPSSVDSDNIFDSLPLTPEFEAIGGSQLFPPNYSLNMYPLPSYEDSIYNNNNSYSSNSSVNTDTSTSAVVYENLEQDPLVLPIQRKRATRRRTTIQQLKCPVCVKVFSRPYNLKSHLRIHTNVRPYVCHFEGCKWTFARPHDLKRHQMLHTGVKPFKCSCGKKFSRSDAFKRHWKVDAVCAARRAELEANALL